MWIFPARYQTYGVHMVDRSYRWHPFEAWMVLKCHTIHIWHALFMKIEGWLQNISSGSCLSCSCSMCILHSISIYGSGLLLGGYIYIYIRSISEHLFRLTPQASFRSFSVPVRRRSHRFTAGVREDLLLTALEEGSGTQRWWRWLGLTPDIKHLWFDGFPIPSPEKNYASP